MQSVRVLVNKIDEKEDLYKLNVKVEMIFNNGEVETIKKENVELWPLMHDIYVNKPTFDVQELGRYYIVNVVEIEGNKYGTLIQNEEIKVNDETTKYTAVVIEDDVGNKEILVPYTLENGNKTSARYVLSDESLQYMEREGVLRLGNILLLHIYGGIDSILVQSKVSKIEEKYNRDGEVMYGGVKWY